jgi:hypothetical protein
MLNRNYVSLGQIIGQLVTLPDALVDCLHGYLLCQAGNLEKEVILS